MDTKRKKKLQNELTDKDAIIRCAEEFGVVGDTTRLKICYLLCRHPELSVSEMAELLDLSISAVSHALRKLRDVKLVASRREAKQVFYRLAETKLSIFIKESLR